MLILLCTLILPLSPFYIQDENLTGMISVSSSTCFSDTSLRSLEFWMCSPFSAGKLSISGHPELVNKMPASILTFGAEFLD